MSKVPCGGFKLDENFLGMNENDELSLVGGGSVGKAYQQLVTDSNGNTQWEDRLAYDDSRLVVNLARMGQAVKIADKVPSWASIDAPIKLWVNNGFNDTVTPEQYTDLGNGSFRITEIVYVITTDNFETNGSVFPKKGVYFVSFNNVYVTGIASADSDTPEITWDGSFGGIKKIDEKFLPDQTVFYTSGSDLVDAEGVKITLEQAKAVGLNFNIQTDYGIARPVSAFYGNGYASFYVAKVLSGGNYNFTKYFVGDKPVN